MCMNKDRSDHFERYHAVRDFLSHDECDLSVILREPDLMHRIRCLHVVDGYGNNGVADDIGSDFIRFLVSYWSPTMDDAIVDCLKITVERDPEAVVPLVATFNARNGYVWPGARWMMSNLKCQTIHI